MNHQPIKNRIGGFKFETMKMEEEKYIYIITQFFEK